MSENFLEGVRVLCEKKKKGEAPSVFHQRCEFSVEF